MSCGHACHTSCKSHSCTNNPFVHVCGFRKPNNFSMSVHQRPSAVLTVEGRSWLGISQLVLSSCHDIGALSLMRLSKSVSPCRAPPLIVSCSRTCAIQEPKPTVLKHRLETRRSCVRTKPLAQSGLTQCTISCATVQSNKCSCTSSCGCCQHCEQHFQFSASSRIRESHHRNFCCSLASLFLRTSITKVAFERTLHPFIRTFCIDVAETSHVSSSDPSQLVHCSSTLGAP